MPNHLQIQNDFERLIERGTLGGSYIFFGPDSGAKASRPISKRGAGRLPEKGRKLPCGRLPMRASSCP